MFKSKKRRCKIKNIVRRGIPKSSAWHNYEYRKNVLYKEANEWQFWKWTSCTKNSKKMYSHRGNKHVKLFKINRTKILSTTVSKCDVQRLNTSDKTSLFVCGDIELNPGPAYNPLSVLTTRLAQMGLRPVNIVGDGNCFFRSVSHQIYQTETHHAQIRALAIQYLINSPEHFIESIADQSWIQYLQNMSRLGTWADHIIIQAVANSHNLRIHITESAPNFSECTIVSPIFDNEPG